MGTAYADVIVGSDRGEYLYGAGGPDRVDGRGGDDWVDAATDTTDDRSANVLLGGTGADPVRSVEMASTGEVAVFGDSYSEALVKSMMAADFKLPQKAVLVSLGKEENKIKLLESIKRLVD